MWTQLMLLVGICLFLDLVFICLHIETCTSIPAKLSQVLSHLKLSLYTGALAIIAIP